MYDIEDWSTVRYVALCTHKHCIDTFVRISNFSNPYFYFVFYYDVLQNRLFKCVRGSYWPIIIIIIISVINYYIIIIYFAAIIVITIIIWLLLLLWVLYIAIIAIHHYNYLLQLIPLLLRNWYSYYKKEYIYSKIRCDACISSANLRREGGRYIVTTCV